MSPTPLAERRPTHLLNDAAAHRPEAAHLGRDGAAVIVAGRDLVALTLAELALPGAQMIWTDFRQSASLGRLHGQIAARGGLDGLMLAADGAAAEEVFSVMCAILCFLPALRRRPGARITLILRDGPSVAALQTLLGRMAARLAEDGVAVDLRVTPARVASR